MTNLRQHLIKMDDHLYHGLSYVSRSFGWRTGTAIQAMVFEAVDRGLPLIVPSIPNGKRVYTMRPSNGAYHQLIELAMRRSWSTSCAGRLAIYFYLERHRDEIQGLENILQTIRAVFPKSSFDHTAIA